MVVGPTIILYYCYKHNTKTTAAAAGRFTEWHARNKK